jgi:hypothetical protein
MHGGGERRAVTVTLMSLHHSRQFLLSSSSSFSSPSDLLPINRTITNVDEHPNSLAPCHSNVLGVHTNYISVLITNFKKAVLQLIS